MVIKNARSHALYELDRGMSFEADDFFAIPLQVLTPEQRDEFETTGEEGERLGWAEVGTRLFQRQCGTAQSDMMGPWVIVQNGVYRYAVVDRGDDSLLVQSVIQEYLATSVYWSCDGRWCMNRNWPTTKPDSQVHHLPRAYDDGLPNSSFTGSVLTTNNSKRGLMCLFQREKGDFERYLGNRAPIGATFAGRGMLRMTGRPHRLSQMTRSAASWC